jgi:hypothetical protein
MEKKYEAERQQGKENTFLAEVERKKQILG